jgi:hypothetical protein
MTGFMHLIVSRDKFRLLHGADDMETYTLKSYYVPRSHPHGISVNVNCLRPGTIESVTVNTFDGEHWEQNISQLSPISD